MPDVIGFVPAAEVHGAPTFANPNALAMAQNSFPAAINRHPAAGWESDFRPPKSGRRRSQRRAQRRLTINARCARTHLGDYFALWGGSN